MVKEKPRNKASDGKPLDSVSIPETIEEKTMSPGAVLIGSKREASSFFKSPDYQPSYDFPYNPDPLCRNNSYRIYDDMQDDDQVKAAISIKKDMVVNTGWQIICDDQDIKDYLTEALKKVNSDQGMAGSFEDVLRDMLSSYVYGFSMTEPVYKVDKETGLWTIAELRTRPPHSFRFDIDGKGNVKNIFQTSEVGEIPFDNKTFIHHVYQVEFGNPYGKSDLRAAYTSWKAKIFVMKFYNIYLEKYASPMMVAKYDNNLDLAMIAEIQAILENAQQSTAMTIPKDLIIEFVQSMRDSSNSYGAALDKYDTKIARAILMPDLLGFSGGETGGGSYALGKEQFRAFLGVIKKDRESLQAKITQRLIKPLVEVNWGPEYAKKTAFEFIPFSDDNILDGAKVWSTAVSSVGWKPSDEEINHLRAITGFPEGIVEHPQPLQFGPDGNPLPPKEAGKPDEGQNKAAPEAEKGGQEQEDNEKEGAEDPEDQPKEQEQANFSIKTYAGRNTTVFEKKVDFKGILDVLDGSEKRVMPSLSRAARTIYSDLIEQARDKGLLRRVKPEAVNALEPKFLKDMNMVFRNHFTDLFKTATGQAKAEIYKDKKYQTNEDLLPEEFLEILKAESFKMVGDYSFELTKRARNIIIQGMKDGVGQGELVTLMREDLAEYTDRWLETVIRTKTTEIYNDARKSFWDNDEFSNQVIEAYQFSAILDDRTTDVCRDLDGAIFERGEYLNRITPPLHFNCRSLLVPVTRFEPYKEDPGYYKKGEEPDLTDLRSSGGGLIATKKDYHIHKKVETPAEEKKDHKIVRIEKVVKRDEYGKVIGMTETPIYE